MSGILFLLIFGVSAVVCHNLAARWGMKPVFWGAMGLVFGPFAIAFLLFARPGDKRND